MARVIVARVIVARVIVAACLTGCVILAGCESSTPKPQGVRLSAMPRSFEPDIPVPIGFEFVDSASEDRSTGTRRLYLRHVYEGKSSKHDVRAFYRDQMSLGRWTKVSDGNINGEYTLRFEKEGESCTIIIRDTKGWMPRTHVQVIISPVERSELPPTARNYE